MRLKSRSYFSPEKSLNRVVDLRLISIINEKTQKIKSLFFKIG